LIALRLLHVPLNREAKRRRKHLATRPAKSAAPTEDDDDLAFQSWLAHVRGENEIVDDVNESRTRQTLANICARTRQGAIEALEALDRLESGWDWCVGPAGEEDPWRTIVTWVRDLWEERVAVSTSVRNGLARYLEYGVVSSVITFIERIS
jgi:hypothetical protein